MYDIFVRLLEQSGKKASDVSKATGIPSSTFSDWKKGKSSPKTEKLQKIADYFGVSLEYLTTGEERVEEQASPYSDIRGIYLSYAKEAQDKGIDPDDIRLALDTIERLRKGK